MSYYSNEEIEFATGHYCELSLRHFSTAYIVNIVDETHVDVKKNEWSTYVLVTDIIRIPFIDKIRHKKLFKLVNGL